MDTGSSAILPGRLFWATVAGFLSGVALKSTLPLGQSAALAFLLFGAAALAIGFLVGKPGQALVVASLFGALALGMTRMDMAALSGDPALTAHLNRAVTIEGTVAAEPDVRDSSVRVNIRASKIVSPVREKVYSGVLAVLPAHADVHYGEQVRAWGKLEAPQTFDTGVGRQFDYPAYLAAQGVSYELSLAGAESLQGAADVGNPLQAAAITIKQTFLRGLGAVLPEPEAGLAGGITVGNKRSIGAQLSQTFQSVGLVHIVVLSGYNITVVLNAAEWVLVRLGAPRLAQFGASGTLVTLFVLMAGGAGSAARAGVMALVAVLARATGRAFLASRALALAALLIVAWNPFSLLFDPSFQLSALATFGLIVFTPLLSPRLSFVTEKFALREITSSTIATQLTVLPLLLYQNGQFAVFALPANLLTLFVIPAAMLFALIAGVSGMLLGALATPLALPAYLLLAYIIKTAQFLASFPYATLSVGAFSAVWAVILYGALLFFAWLAHIKKSGRTS